MLKQWHGLFHSMIFYKDIFHTYIISPQPHICLATGLGQQGCKIKRKKTLYSHKVADVFSYMTRNYFFKIQPICFFCVCSGSAKKQTAK